MKLLTFFSLLLALGGSFFWFGKDLLGREPSAAELTLACALLAVAGVGWLLALRQRQRQKVQALRDSALW